MIRIILSAILLLILPIQVWSETLTWDDLVERNDLYYKKFTNVPFTGEISNIDIIVLDDVEFSHLENGKIKNGKRIGEWLTYNKNGQLIKEGNYIDGKRNGFWISYNENGQIFRKQNYKDGKKNGLYFLYRDSGQVLAKGNFKDGKMDGIFEIFNKEGTLKRTQTFKDGKMINQVNY